MILEDKEIRQIKAISKRIVEAYSPPGSIDELSQHLLSVIEQTIFQHLSSRVEVKQKKV